VKPWSGPLPSPRHSPLRTLGDAMANAKKKESKEKSPHQYVSGGHQHGSQLSQIKPVRSWPRPTLTGQLDRGESRLDLAHTGRGESRSDTGINDVQKSSCTGDSALPATSTAVSMQNQSQVRCKENLNLKSETQGSCCGVMQTEVVKGYKGRHASCMGLNPTPSRPTNGYRPTPVLITLFRKTGTPRRNPKTLRQAAAPSNSEPLPQRRSYAKVVRSGMEGRGMYGNGASNGVRGNGSGSFRGQSQGESFVRPGYQRLHQ
jgi:hypothetical protein